MESHKNGRRWRPPKAGPSSIAFRDAADRSLTDRERARNLAPKSPDMPLSVLCSIRASSIISPMARNRLDRITEGVLISVAATLIVGLVYGMTHHLFGGTSSSSASDTGRQTSEITTPSPSNAVQSVEIPPSQSSDAAVSSVQPASPIAAPKPPPPPQIAYLSDLGTVDSNENDEISTSPTTMNRTLFAQLVRMDPATCTTRTALFTVPTWAQHFDSYVGLRDAYSDNRSWIFEIDRIDVGGTSTRLFQQQVGAGQFSQVHLSVAGAYRVRLGVQYIPTQTLDTCEPETGYMAVFANAAFTRK